MLVVERIAKRYGGLVAVDALSLTAESGRITAVIGPNGAGKTTLMNLISGVTSADSGRLEIGGRDITSAAPHVRAKFGLSRTYQHPQLFEEMTVLETVMVGAHLSGAAGPLWAMLRLGSVRREEQTLEEFARAVLKRVGLPDALLDRRCQELAYGLQRRVEIARALAVRPKVLLLDEPAAGLNANETSEVSDLIQDLARNGYAVVLVEHDMEMVMGISDRVVVMNFGRKIAEGTPDEIQENEHVIDAYLGRHRREIENA